MAGISTTSQTHISDQTGILWRDFTYSEKLAVKFSQHVFNETIEPCPFSALAKGEHVLFVP